MSRIEITTEPHELIINGDTFLMQADPSASAEWDTLLETKWDLKTVKARQKSRTDLTEALAALAETPDEGERFREFVTKNAIGVPTLKVAAVRYMEAVTGFPTVPSPSSTTG
jgi:hypothetical protein